IFFYKNSINMLKQLQFSKTIYVLFFSLFLFSCADDPEETISVDQELSETKTHALIPKSEIDAFIFESLEKNNEFDWSQASDEMLWSALMQSDSALTIGYQPEKEGDI